ncbi:unnamed protein product (macronuclear) [Paramecium tetraurelia]|uniref:Transmembrane protein n=1 Tax=Paramecium tetraurelia TaxID=5888 RepID=A0E4T8_PARTE|nr:uncharacterized protein GSPATT00023480001 [Paramecium tetraurelia]CAK90305.1 unnamed protein product [Paramecium tetraurelia]|eukprot:XP_001457702.1 hypothetical protein (macronuclear) [Paramecium tetraurelia strain d4-2]
MINLFPKIQDNQYNRQSWGGLLFLITIIFIVIMIWTEITNAFKGKISLLVDSTIDSRIRVNLDATIQAPCQALFQHIRYDGFLFIRSTFEEAIFKPNVNFTSCYGAELIVDQRCYSCQDVMMAFAQRRWTQPNFESIVQCVGQPIVQFDDSELLQFLKTDLNHQKQLYLTKNELINITPTQLFKQSFELDDNDTTNQILTQEQRGKFKKALDLLSEFSYNPMQWDEQRLQEEKNKQFDQLINMLNISMDHIIGGTKKSKQFKFFNISIVINLIQFQINHLINLKSHQNTRQLFSEPFKVEQPSQQNIEVSDIEGHINEACRFFGYFYIKKVPGILAIQSNKQAMDFINRTFQGNHSFKLSFGEQPQTQTETNSQFSSKYYLKLVTTNSIDIWNNRNVYYTFTQQRSLYNATTAPFIEFQYEFDPISMTVQSTTIINYLVLVFAVIGGIFAVSKYIAVLLMILI